VAVEFESFRSRLPAFGEFFAVENWFWLALTLAVTKVLHEFGHGLVCKRMGGACHEMGVMLLVLTPCLYVNVSDSWMLPSRFRRAAIGAAGMYVELVLAACCTFLWWFSEPGLFNYLCLNVMFVSSVTTVLFNANPLLRYDGYYILSDLLEIPNLRSKASAVLQRKLGRLLLGLREPPDPFLPQRHQSLFALYTIASGLYSWVITFSILWFLDQVFKPYGLQVVGQMIALAAMYGLIVHPLWRLCQFFHVPGRIEKVNRARATLSFAGIIAVAAAALFVPLPYYVECPFTLAPRDAANVYVSVPGTLDAIHVAAGEAVAPGQPLVTLASLDVELTLAKIEGEREELLAKVDDLRRRQYLDPDAAMEVAEVEETLRAVDEQLAKRHRDRQRLQIAAPVAGIVLPPEKVKPQRADRSELATWSGTPLAAENLGATLEEGVLVCRVGNPQTLQAVIDVDQSQIEFVRPQQQVYLKLDALAGDTFVGKIAQVAQLEREAPDEAQPATESESTARLGAEAKLLDTKYQASAPLDDQEQLLFASATGTARIRAGYFTAAERLWRWLSQTFRFQR
jgi:putative peptide zinc metalloprotease protein